MARSPGKNFHNSLALDFFWFEKKKMTLLDDIHLGGRLAHRLDDAIVFIQRQTPTFHTVTERINAARRLLEEIVADNYAEHVYEEYHPEKRATIARWARDFVNDMRLQNKNDQNSVVVGEFLNNEDPALLEKFAKFCSTVDENKKRSGGEEPILSPPAKKTKTSKTDENVPAALRDGIASVLGWATPVDEYERNDLVECKVHAAWHLTSHLDATERLKILSGLKEDYERACKDEDGKWKKKKRLMWAVVWIDEMIRNVETGESFDDSLGVFSTDRF